MKTQIVRLAIFTCLGAFVFLAFAGEASAQDQITLQDGTVLEGRVVYIDHNYLTVTTPILDHLEIFVWDIKAITTAAPMHVLTHSAQWLVGTITTTSDGKMELNPEGGGDPIEIHWYMVKGVFPDKVRWANGFTFGGSFTQGNTDVLGFNFTGAGTREGETNRFFWTISYTWAKAEGRIVKDNADGTLKFDRQITGRTYWWVAEELHYDQLKDLDLRSVTSGGIGYFFLSTPITDMAVEAGLGYMAERFTQEDDENNPAFRGAWNWEQLIGRNMKFINRFVTYLGGESVKYQFVNKAEFKLDLSRTWRFKVTNDWYYDKAPSSFVGHESDMEWLVGFEYVF
jgi:putative salt-induced outer membrane protein YdiY